MLRWVKKASTLEGALARRARSGKGAGFGAGTGGVEDGMGSPEGRSAIGVGGGSAVVISVAMMSRMVDRQ